jgi:hypothetical protein
MPPQAAGTQVGLIFRDQHHVSSIITDVDLVRTAKREHTTLDPQLLLDDLELQRMRWVNGGDALYQNPTCVCAAHRRPDAILVALGSNWVGQQGAEKERRVPGNLLIEHDVIPDLIRGGV